MSYRKRLTFLILLDSVIVSTAIFIATWVVYPAHTEILRTETILWSAIALLVFHHLFASVYKLYNKVWAYASVGELVTIVKAITFSIVGAGIVQYFINDFSLYSRALLVTWMLHILLIGGSRFVWRIYRDSYIKQETDQKRTLIVGAGAAGAMIARQLKNEHSSELSPVAFVDDDINKQKMQVYDLPVEGTTRDIAAVVEKLKIEHIVIAIPSLRNGELEKIVAECNKANVKVQMIPKIEDLMTGKISVSHLKNVEVEDLLGREPVKLDIGAISEYVTGSTVMVTGAGGSIGSEICRQLMRFAPEKILLVGHGEYSIYSIDMELKNKYHDTETEIIPIIGDVQDRERIFNIVEEHHPRIIYHAAAHKHVPLMEYNPHEAVKNNVIGTKNVAEAADTFGVKTFVMVSTDKAVNPTNVMGATKRVAEMVVQHMAQQSKTKFVAVRFGNVLGSRGSVIPLFKKQIEKGGPVTVTDPEMTRYFMTIPEASRLVIQAGTLAKGGEIFVLDMGEPVKIVDLAKNLIKLSGYTEDEIPIEFSGIRPGEKMYEELLGEDEILPGEVYEKIYVGRTVEVDTRVVLDLICEFDNYDAVKLKNELMRVVFTERELLRVKG
ncbi:polysaccharide biosynthesis protein [Oceanobacillus profundus]|uniref:polysaccharide biosynthesis protein n=1 Tax=Oceanobacillus profundus TaxID=372463 RepID=UPI0026E40F6A|nr:nucleoside-diphosphate sugar epimerase/dehydratase [Oceanobacillus profundus]MDO6450505.1 nucleoside-diphosphate sugar epimerase/dehydratase [Oceanobacillus profundus]